MIRFVTLFLGLLSGPHPVAIEADPRVAAIEIHLDGALVGKLEEPPWRLEVDFGSDLAPHRLEAVALDGEGTELDRIRQPINLPRPGAEATLLLERDERGVPTLARIGWQSVLDSKPRAVRLSLDGEPVPVSDPAEVPLPKVDPGDVHWLEAEVELPGGVVARARRVFGGGLGDEVSREITAVAVERSGSGRGPKVQDLRGRLRARASTLEVVGVERTSAELVLVRAAGVSSAIQRIAQAGVRSMGSAVVLGSLGASSVGDLRGGATASTSDAMRRALTLDDDVSLRLLLPESRTTQSGLLRMDVFPTSPRITPKQGGLAWALTREVHLAGVEKGQRLADAVAVAGLRAAAGNRRRAVVLILGSDLAETSLHSPAATLAFLEKLGVPFEIWTVDPAATQQGPWRSARDVSDLRKLRRAVSDLEKRLARQSIVWVEGTHLPQAIELSGGGRFSLAR